MPRSSSNLFKFY